MSIKGTIIKGIGGYYYISCGKETFECRACGRFRNEKIKPLVGDIAVFDAGGTSGGYITEIEPRRNRLIRPAVANIDKLVIVLAASRPKPDLMLADKLIVQAMRSRIRPIICVNKTDDTKKDTAREICAQYACIENVCVSAQTGDNIEALAEMLKGGITAFAGQSAVGKSSLLNALNTDCERQTGDLSAKTDRGRHTTREVELICCEKTGGFIIDTPGFSMLDSGDIEAEELKDCYGEFAPYADKCYFSSCMHMDEPDCAVKAAVSNGELNKERYERYRLFVEYLKEKKEKKYD